MTLPVRPGVKSKNKWLISLTKSLLQNVLFVKRRTLKKQKQTLLGGTERSFLCPKSKIGLCNIYFGQVLAFVDGLHK